MASHLVQVLDEEMGKNCLHGNNFCSEYHIESGKAKTRGKCQTLAKNIMKADYVNLVLFEG